MFNTVWIASRHMVFLNAKIMTGNKREILHNTQGRSLFTISSDVDIDSIANIVADPCRGIRCGVNSVCDNGVCVCLSGYEARGSICTSKFHPTIVILILHRTVIGIIKSDSSLRNTIKFFQ